MQYYSSDLHKWDNDKLICLNGMYFNKIKIAKVVEKYRIEYEFDFIGKYPGEIHIWFDVEINGQELGLHLDKKEEADNWLKENLNAIL